MTEQKVKYKCTNCEFAFTRRHDHKVLNCPNCGKNSLEVRPDSEAQSILDEVSRMEHLYDN